MKRTIFKIPSYVLGAIALAAFGAGEPVIGVIAIVLALGAALLGGFFSE